MIDPMTDDDAAARRRQLIRYEGPPRLAAPRAARFFGLAVLALAVALLAVAMLGCGVTATSARKALSTAADIQIEGMKTFHAFDVQHQEAIAAKDEPVADRRAEIAAYRPIRANARGAFDALAAATVAASAFVDALEAGVAKSSEWPAYLAAVIAAASTLYAVLHALHIDVPALDKMLGQPIGGG